MSNEPHHLFLQDYIQQLIDKQAIVNVHNDKINLTGKIREVYILNNSSYMRDATEPDIMSENYEPLVIILFDVDSVDDFNNVSDKKLKTLIDEIDITIGEFYRVRKKYFPNTENDRELKTPHYLTEEESTKMDFVSVGNRLTLIDATLNNIRKFPTTILLQIHLYDTMISELHQDSD